MPLVPSPMQAEFLALYKSYAASPRESARRQAKAYDLYAKQALASPSKPVFTGSETQALEDKLYQAIMQYRTGTPERYARAWAEGVFSYWMSPPLQFSGGGIIAGVVSAAPVQPIIFPQLMSLYRNIQGTAESVSAQQASILHAGTLLVMATLTFPGSPPVQITVPVT